MQPDRQRHRYFRRHRRPRIRQVAACDRAAARRRLRSHHLGAALRWFAHHGFGVLAPDLPGHGRSGGEPLTTIADMADWTAALLDAAGAAKARLVGHSMGSLIALETAARHPAKVSALSLIGTAATMTVGPDLLKAAEANDPDGGRHGLDLGPRLSGRTRRQPRTRPVDALRRAAGARTVPPRRAVQRSCGLQRLSGRARRRRRRSKSRPR